MCATSDYKYGRMRGTRVEQGPQWRDRFTPAAYGKRSMNREINMEIENWSHVTCDWMKKAQYLFRVDIMQLCWKCRLIGYINVHYRDANWRDNKHAWKKLRYDHKRSINIKKNIFGRLIYISIKNVTNVTFFIVE